MSARPRDRSTPFPSNHHAAIISMSTQQSSSSSAATPSNASDSSPNFDVALDDFKTRTGHDLSSHSFAAVIDSCTTPKAILYEYRKQVRKNYNQYRKGDSRLMNALKPIVHGLYTMSQSETTKLVSVPFLLMGHCTQSPIYPSLES
jgi:hypothetical protein